jgi:hypothetical protein
MGTLFLDIRWLALGAISEVVSMGCQHIEEAKRSQHVIFFRNWAKIRFES